MQNCRADEKVVEEKYSMGKFRGTWNATIGMPAFDAFVFLPSAPAMKPRVRVDQIVEEVDYEIVVETGELLTGPPADADVLLCIRDRYNNYRSYISSEGVCWNNLGRIIGYINIEDNQAGSVDEEYLGCLNETLTNICQVEDSLDEIAGMLDMGKAYIKNAQEQTVAELSNDGTCTGHAGTYLGEFEGFHYRHMKVIALYLMLIDPGMLNEVEG